MFSLLTGFASESLLNVRGRSAPIASTAAEPSLGWSSSKTTGVDARPAVLTTRARTRTSGMCWQLPCLHQQAHLFGGCCRLGSRCGRHLRRAAATRHDDAVARTREAITEARRIGQPVTFATIARASAVSRSWLYKPPDIREAIGTLRQDPPRGLHPGAATQRATSESLHQRLDAARAEIGRLRTDNALLRDQLERSLGAQRLHR